MNLTRVVVITGAEGGLGRVLTRTFAEKGWQVAAVGHASPPTDLPSNATGFAVELLDSTAVTQVFDQIHDAFGRLDMLIHNAGATADELLSRLSVDAWDQCLDVNLRGAFLCARAAIQPMLRVREGQIVFVGSHAAHGALGQAAYASAKAGLFGLSNSLARELGDHNIRVNTVCPGLLPTSMTAALPPHRLEELVQANLLGRINDLEEVARFVAHLADTRNISGQIFQLDSRVNRWA